MQLTRKLYKAFLSAASPQRGSSARPLFRLFQFATASVIIVLLIDLLAIKRVTFGEFGDFLGGVLNPILTFLTFMGLLMTIVIQQAELRDSRVEMRRSADALAEQSNSLKRQNFESTFFQMLSIHNGIVNAIDLSDSSGKTTRGRDCFNVFYRRFNKIYRENKEKSAGRHTNQAILQLSYRLFWKEHQTELGHYFRYLYNIVRFIKEEGFAQGPYLRQVRAQLSDQELLLLFYNCVSPNGGNFTPLVEEFSLLDNMPRIRLLEKAHASLMAPQAFGLPVEA